MEFSSAVRTSAEQKQLILKLEHDLSTIQTMSSLSRPNADGSEGSDTGNIPEPIKEVSAMFSGKFLIIIAHKNLITLNLVLQSSVSFRSRAEPTS